MCFWCQGPLGSPCCRDLRWGPQVLLLQHNLPSCYHPAYLPPNGLGLRLTTREVVKAGTLNTHHHGNTSEPHPRPPLDLNLFRGGWLMVVMVFYRASLETLQTFPAIRECLSSESMGADYEN